MFLELYGIIGIYVSPSLTGRSDQIATFIHLITEVAHIIFHDKDSEWINMFNKALKRYIIMWVI